MPSRPLPHTFAARSRSWDDDHGAMRRQRWDDRFRMAMLLAWLMAAALLSLTRCAAPVPALTP